MTETQPAGTPSTDALFTAERSKAFVDAVVAIAMTLLILPLMESVTESAAGAQGAAEWFAEHWSQVLSFVLSFAIIAMFWISLHRLFSNVERVSNALLWLSMLWLISIVWLPIPTAMVGSMDDHDPVVKVAYIGSMIVTALITLVIRLYLQAHPALHEIPADRLRSGMAADLAMATLFTAALALSLLIPAVSYYALFGMFLTGPLQHLYARMLGVPGARRVSGRTG